MPRWHCNSINAHQSIGTLRSAFHRLRIRTRRHFALCHTSGTHREWGKTLRNSLGHVVSHYGLGVADTGPPPASLLPYLPPHYCPLSCMDDRC